MSGALKQTALVAALIFAGMALGLLLHAWGGSIWLVPEMAFGVPVGVFVGAMGCVIFRAGRGGRGG